MNPAEMSFTIMEYFGIWRPTSWTSKWAIRFYNFYNSFMLAYMYFYGLTFLISLCQNLNDLDLVTENIFFSSGIFLNNLKHTYISLYREDIIAFKKMFLQTKCNARNIYEMRLLEKFHKIDRSNSRIFLILALITTSIHVFAPLTKGKNVTLPFRSWVPYNIDSRSVFWLTYIYQGSGIFQAVSLFVAFETFVSVMLQQICAQLEIIMYRLIKIPEVSKENKSQIDIDRQEAELVQDCITHHVYMFAIEEKLNYLFGFIVLIQFFATTLNLCTVVYQLSKISVSNFKFWSVAGILVCYIVQIFLYCWYGDEMMEKSSAIADAVYKMNWSKLTQKTRKNLIMIMLRASRPIRLNGTSMITMSVDTFVKIVKTSYSAFNLLLST